MMSRLPLLGPATLLLLTLVALWWQDRATPRPPRDPAQWLQDPRGAAIAWERATVADPRRAAQRDFVFGHLHWQRAEQFSIVLAEADPPPAAFVRPLAETEAAQRAWEAAAEGFAEPQAGAPDPQAAAVAGRNAARAAARREELRAAQQRAHEQREQQPPPADPGEGATSAGDEEGDRTQVAAVRSELGPEQLAELDERLRQMEEEKRRARLATRPPSAGGDW